MDFAGVSAGAKGGALEAKQNRIYQFDFVGVIGLGLISALGGGIARDVLLQHGPPLAFTGILYLLIALAGGLFGLLHGSNPGRKLGKLLILVDVGHRKTQYGEDVHFDVQQIPFGGGFGC